MLLPLVHSLVVCSGVQAQGVPNCGGDRCDFGNQCKFKHVDEGGLPTREWCVVCVVRANLLDTHNQGGGCRGKRRKGEPEGAKEGQSFILMRTAWGES